MGRELDDATILSIHRQFAHGKAIFAIAKELGVCHKTVRRYLRGDSKPHPRIARRIAGIHGYRQFDPPRPPDTPDGFITLREASRIVPYEPSPENLAKHTRPDAHPRLRAKIIDTGKGACGRVLVTRTEWVKSWNAERIGPHPRGIAINMTAATEVIDPNPDEQRFREMVIGIPGASIKIGGRRCIMLENLESLVDSLWDGQRELSFPPGFLDAVRARAEASGTRLFVITRETFTAI